MLAANSETIEISRIVPERTGHFYAIEEMIKVVMISAKTRKTRGAPIGRPSVRIYPL
jgi:hypothetical protein